MAKQKQNKSGQAPKVAGKRQGFNTPFAELKKTLKRAATPKSAQPAQAHAAAPVDQPDPADETIFFKAMADVARLAGAERVRPSDGQPPPLTPPPDDDLEVMAHLADLVAGATEFDMRWSPGFIEGRQFGVAEDLMEQMRRGAFPIQDHLDLHGMSQDQAAAALEDFVARSAAKGMRHVLIVHGRGLSSPGGVPVLKQALPGWLARKRMRRQVLAFCTALGHDGGEGSIYVLLRKWSGPGRGGVFG